MHAPDALISLLLRFLVLVVQIRADSASFPIKQDAELQLLVLLPNINGSSNACRASMGIAVEAANRLGDLLPGYRLNVTYSDEEEATAKTLIDFVDEPPKLIAPMIINGQGCQNNIVAQVLLQYGKIDFDLGCSSPVYVKNRYMATMPFDDLAAVMLTKLATFIGERREVAIISSLENKNDWMRTELLFEAVYHQSRSVQVVYFEASSLFLGAEQASALISSRARTIILVMTESRQTAEFLCRAYKNGIQAPQFAYLLPADVGFLISDVTETETSQCSKEVIQEQLTSFFLMKMWPDPKVDVTKFIGRANKTQDRHRYICHDAMMQAVITLSKLLGQNPELVNSNDTVALLKAVNQSELSRYPQRDRRNTTALIEHQVPGAQGWQRVFSISFKGGDVFNSSLYDVTQLVDGSFVRSSRIVESEMIPPPEFFWPVVIVPTIFIFVEIVIFLLVFLRQGDYYRPYPGAAKWTNLPFLLVLVLANLLVQNASGAYAVLKGRSMYYLCALRLIAAAIGVSIFSSLVLAHMSLLKIILARVDRITVRVKKCVEKTPACVTERYWSREVNKFARGILTDKWLVIIPPLIASCLTGALLIAWMRSDDPLLPGSYDLPEKIYLPKNGSKTPLLFINQYKYCDSNGEHIWLASIVALNLFLLLVASIHVVILASRQCKASVPLWLTTTKRSAFAASIGGLAVSSVTVLIYVLLPATPQTYFWRASTASLGLTLFSLVITVSLLYPQLSSIMPRSMTMPTIRALIRSAFA